MELNSLKMAGTSIVSVMKRIQNPIQDDDPASTKSPHPVQKHDVFLSFRGIDTRRGIASSLYYELKNSDIKTFMDDQGLEAGTEISSNLQTAIEESRSAIVLLSKNYASSRWCLEELANIIQGMEARNMIVLPVFLEIDPSDVRHQRGSFAKAFTTHEKRLRRDDGIMKIKRWRAALKKVANLSGLDSNKYRSDRELVEGIVQLVCSRVQDLELESTADFVEFETTRKAMDEIMNALKDGRLEAECEECVRTKSSQECEECTKKKEKILEPIGIYGMGGIGKTTLVYQVAAQAKREGLFTHVLMVVVTQTPDWRKIQGMLADQLKIKLEQESDTGRATRLRKEIMKRNSILIILDDIWEVIDLSRIGIPSYEKLQMLNSRVIFTTRSSYVCDSMKSKPNIGLNVLSEEDSWSLFVKKTKMSFETSAGRDVAMKVASQCAGLPVALIAIAGALRNKELKDWNEAAEQLMSSQLSSPGDGIDVFKCIKLSYDYLRSEDAKSLFLLCCLFPEDYDIPIEDLFRYGIGRGIFQDCNTLQEARAKARSVLRYLKSSSLLSGTKHDERVRMHDAVRQMAIKISLSEDDQRVLVKAGRNLGKWPMINATKGYCAISVMVNEINKLPVELQCSKLQILLLQHNAKLREIPDLFFRSLDELRVLDLSKTSISVLPPSFCFLKNLQSLSLDSCENISDISLLGSVEKIQILSLRDCHLKEVPEQIGNLTCLRMLDITGSGVVKIAPKVISRLWKLEELYMQCSFGDWGSKVEEAGGETNVGFDELTGLDYLKTLQVSISDSKFLPKIVESPPDWVYFNICISKEKEVVESTWKPQFSHGHSRTLTLSTVVHTLPDWFIDVVTAKVEKLQYRRCEDLKNILEEHARGRLQALKHLVVFECNGNLEELMKAETFSYSPVFQNLEELHLCEVANMKKLCVGELPPASLSSLKLLDVQRCHNLVNELLHSSLLQRMSSLEKLFCAHMDGLEYVFGSGEAICEKLQEMRLCHLPKLTKIWNGLAPRSVFHSVKSLVVHGCRNMECLFTSDVAQCLLQLVDLWVYSCFSLNSIVEATNVAEHTNLFFPNLKNLVLANLPRLRTLYSNGSESLDIEFISLEYFHSWGTPKFSSLAFNFFNEKQVQVNDYQHYRYLKKRLMGDTDITGDGLWKYDVFLSFRGAHTCQGITSKIYEGLHNYRRIKILKDDQDLEAGAIRESGLAIVVLSPNYISSPRCLEELSKICVYMEDRIIPIFYHLILSNLNRDFEEALIMHQNSGKHSSEKIQQWRDALKEVVNISGLHAQKYRSDKELVDDIVKLVWSKVLQVRIKNKSSSTEFREFEEFAATKLAMDLVMEGLQDNEVAVIGVYGMGGVGKTTLVKYVGVQAQQIGLFNTVIFAVVSIFGVDLEEIQVQLADILGLLLVGETEESRAFELRKRIMSEKNLLIVLDDIWRKVELSKIGIPNNVELQQCNSKVVLTTRLRNVCREMDCQAIIKLNSLSEEESLKLLLKKAGVEVHESTVLYNVAREIASLNAGLPAELTKVGRALGGKDLDVDVWNETWKVFWRMEMKRRYGHELMEMERRYGGMLPGWTSLPGWTRMERRTRMERSLRDGDGGWWKGGWKDKGYKGGWKDTNPNPYLNKTSVGIS